MATRISFTMNGRVIQTRLRQLDAEAKAAITAVVDRNALIGEGDMKVNAPWTDRTSAARSGLFTSASHSGGGHEILFSHAVHYGIWLEVKNSGKYEIIMPSVRKAGNRIMNDLDGLFGKL